MLPPTAAEAEGPTGVRAAVRAGTEGPTGVRAVIRTLDELPSSYA